MTRSTINNGESGSVVRGKLNDNFAELYNETQFTADFASGVYSNGSGFQADLAAWLTATSGTFTRGGSDHRYFNSSGNLVNGSANQLRITYDPNTLKPLGALIEPSRQNLMVYSDVFTNAVWAFSNSNITRTDDAATGVTGSTTAATIVENTTASVVHRMWYYSASVTVTSGSPYCFSFYLKAIGTRGVYLQPSAPTGLGNTVIMPGQLKATNGWNVEKLPNGWVRVWKTATAASSGVANFVFDLWNGYTSIYTGNGSSGVAIEKAQLELVSSTSDGPSSYIDNSATTQNTRSADALAFTVPADTFYSIYGTGQYASASISAGAYSYTPVTTNLILRRFSDTLPEVLTVCDKSLGANLTKQDITGLTSTDTPKFSGLELSSGVINFGSSSTGCFQASGCILQWTTGTVTANPNPSTLRAVLIGGDFLGSVSNCIVVGIDAGKNAAVSTSTVINDTAGGAATVITGSEVIGNEAGNVHTSITTSVLIGNLGGYGVASSTATQSVSIGQQSSRGKGLNNTVVIGYSAALGTAGGSLVNCVIIGSSAANNVGNATLTNLNLIGYNVTAPTSTTSDYLNICNVIRSDLTGSILVLTNPSGAGECLELLEMTAPSAGAANTARIYAEDNGSGKTRLMVRFPSGASQQIAIEP